MSEPDLVDRVIAARMASSDKLYEQLQRLIDLPDHGVRSLSIHIGVNQPPTVVIERYIEDSADLELETKRFTLVDQEDA